MEKAFRMSMKAGRGVAIVRSAWHIVRKATIGMIRPARVIAFGATYIGV